MKFHETEALVDDDELLPGPEELPAASWKGAGCPLWEKTGWRSMGS